MTEHSVMTSKAKVLAGRYSRAFMLICAEVLGFCVSLLAVSTYLGNGQFPTPAEIATIFLPFLVIQAISGQYFRRRTEWDDVGKTLKTISLMILFSASALHVNFAGATFSALIWCLSGITITSSRAFTRHLFRVVNFWNRDVIIVGTGERALELAEQLEKTDLLGYRLRLVISERALTNLQFNQVSLRAKLSDEESYGSINISGQAYPLLLDGCSLEHAVSNLQAPRVLFALDPDFDFETLEVATSKFEFLQCELSSVHGYSNLPNVGAETEVLGTGGLILVRHQNKLGFTFNRVLKRCFDISAAIAGLILFSPLLVLVSVFVRKSGQSIIFRHKRVGLGGRSFGCLKFRTMFENSDEMLEMLLKNDAEARAEWEQDFKLRNDPRITPIGHFLRKTSLDELPQLINILKGEMSFVGPRPITLEELPRYEPFSVFYLSTKPGLTGLWQVSGRNDLSYSERVRLDIWYSKNWSLWIDLGTIFKTAVSIFSKNGAY